MESQRHPKSMKSRYKTGSRFCVEKCTPTSWKWMPLWSPKWSKIWSKTYIIRKVPTRVWIEPARSDCVSGLPSSLPKSRKNVLEIRRAFSAKFLLKKVPQTNQKSTKTWSAGLPKRTAKTVPKKVDKNTKKTLHNEAPQSDFFDVFQGLGPRVPQGGPRDPPKVLKVSPKVLKWRPRAIKNR